MGLGVHDGPPSELQLSKYAFVRLNEDDVRRLFACLDARPGTAGQPTRGAAVRLSLNWEDGTRGAVARPVPTPPVTLAPGLRALAVVRELKNPALKVQGFKVRLKVAVNATAVRS